MRSTYHVSATLSDAPLTSEADDATLESEYLEMWDRVPQGKGFTKPGRQILHCKFGSVLTDANLSKLVHECLKAYADT